MNRELAKTIGVGCKAARQSLHLTQEDVADRVGISVEFYARIERGTSQPSILTFVRLVSALGASADALLGRPSVAFQTATLLPPPANDSPDVRRLTRRLRVADKATLRLVTMLLKEMERRPRKANYPLTAL